jgi:hypothetical protein
VNLSPKESFLWGSLGALLPLIFGWFKALNALTPLPSVQGPYAVLLVVITVVFVIAAGFLTVAWRPDAPIKALWVGASSQLIVATFLQQAPKLPV